MAGAVGIVFGLCVLSFTVGAALMYVVMRRREDASEAPPAPAVPAGSGSAPGDAWVPRPVSVEPVADDYDTRPIHRNPVVGLPRVEPALATFAEPVVGERVELAPVEDGPIGVVPVDGPVEVVPVEVAAPETVGASRYAQDGDFAPPMGDVEAPESTVAPSTDSSAVVAEPEPAPEAVTPVEPAEVASAAEVTGAAETVEATETTEATEATKATEPALPPPATPQPTERTTWAERDEFRQRYLRTFDEVRRKASSN